MKLAARLATAALVALPSVMFATTVNVPGTSSVYCPNNDTACASAQGATPGTVINVTGYSSITFNVTGTISFNSGANNNDPDGVGSAFPAGGYLGGNSMYSGITAPNVAYLTGLFTGSSMTRGTDTFYTTMSVMNSSFSPTQNQVFFIGDGLTGDLTGSTQTFYIPLGATSLTLGFADAGYIGGPPGSYSDNSGNLVANYALTSAAATTPEPSGLILLSTGVLGVAGAVRRRFAQRS